MGDWLARTTYWFCVDSRNVLNTFVGTPQADTASRSSDLGEFGDRHVVGGAKAEESSALTNARFQLNA